MTHRYRLEQNRQLHVQVVARLGHRHPADHELLGPQLTRGQKLLAVATDYKDPFSFLVAEVATALGAAAAATVVEPGRSMVSCRGISHHQAAHPLLGLVAASQLVRVPRRALVRKRLRAGYPRQRCTEPLCQAHHSGPCQPLAGCEVTRNQQGLGVRGLALANRPVCLERRCSCSPHRVGHHHIGPLGQ